jgi:hypothetical protein
MCLHRNACPTSLILSIPTVVQPKLPPATIPTPMCLNHRPADRSQPALELFERPLMRFTLLPCRLRGSPAWFPLALQRSFRDEVALISRVFSILNRSSSTVYRTVSCLARTEIRAVENPRSAVDCAACSVLRRAEAHLDHIVPPKWRGASCVNLVPARCARGHAGKVRWFDVEPPTLLGFVTSKISLVCLPRQIHQGRFLGTSPGFPKPPRPIAQGVPTLRMRDVHRLWITGMGSQFPIDLSIGRCRTRF